MVLIVAGMHLVSACSDPSAQIKAMTDHYHKELDRKEEELIRLRESEKAQQAELAGVKAQLETIQTEAEKTRAASQGIDPEKISELLIKALEPKLDPIIAKSVEKTLKSAQLAPVAQTTPTQSTTGKPVPPPQYGTQPQPRTGQPPPSSSNDSGKLPSNDPNVQRFEFRFD